MQVSLTAAIRRNLIESRDRIIYQVASAAIDVSPVDTGAYVTSFSATTTSGGGRSRSSDGLPRRQSIEAKRGEAKSQILDDLARIPPEVEKVYITNRAPHAPYVEGRKTAPMATARNKANLF